MFNRLYLLLLPAFLLFSFSVYADTDIKKTEKWADTKVSELVNALNSSDFAEKYKKLLNLVGTSFDYKNMIRFGFGAKNLQKLSIEEKGYLEEHAKRYLVLTFFERLSTFDVSFKIRAVEKNRSLKNSYNILIDVLNIEGISMENIKGIRENLNPEKATAENENEVVIVVRKTDDGYIMTDLKALDLSLLISMKEMYQKAVSRNREDMNMALDELISSLERRENNFMRKYSIPESLFPPIKTLLTIEIG